jgi:hypothetical protein
MGLTPATVRYLVSKNATCMFLTAILPRFIRKLIEHEIPDIHFIKPSYNSASDRRILEQKRHILERPLDGDILSNIDVIVRESDKSILLFWSVTMFPLLNKYTENYIEPT